MVATATAEFCQMGRGFRAFFPPLGVEIKFQKFRMKNSARGQKKVNIHGLKIILLFYQSRGK